MSIAGHIQNKYLRMGNHVSRKSIAPVSQHWGGRRLEQELMKKIYISGGITGVQDYMEHFSRAQKFLVKKYKYVVNPALINSNLPGNRGYDDYIRVSMALLQCCNMIYMLRGWEKSRGAMLEHQYAKTMGYGILYEA